MKLDWVLLRLPLATLGSAIVVSAILVAAAVSYDNNQLRVSSKLESDLTNAKRRYENARRDKALYRQYVETYLDYSERGIIGAEQRLNWIEELQEINKQLKLPSLKYEISPQVTAGIPGVKLPENIFVRSSSMHLSAGLLHEGDGLFILDALRSRAGGFYALQACKMAARLPEGRLDYRPNVTYVDMDCELDWYTVIIES